MAVINMKSNYSVEKGYRCLDCRGVQKKNGICQICESSNLKEIKIHSITPKSVISEPGKMKYKPMEAK